MLWDAVRHPPQMLLSLRRHRRGGLARLRAGRHAGRRGRDRQPPGRHPFDAAGPAVRHLAQGPGDGVPFVGHLPAGAGGGHLLHRLLLYPER